MTNQQTTTKTNTSHQPQCIVCSQSAVTSFFCPCDLTHGLCAEHQDIERKDCAHIYDGDDPATCGTCWGTRITTTSTACPECHA